MRGAKAKRLRATARMLAAKIRTTTTTVGPLYYLTGYRRIYRDLKRMGA